MAPQLSHRDPKTLPDFPSHHSALFLMFSPFLPQGLYIAVPSARNFLRLLAVLKVLI